MIIDNVTARFWVVLTLASDRTSRRVKGAKVPPKPKAGGKYDKGKHGNDIDVVEALLDVEGDSRRSHSPSMYFCATQCGDGVA
eukprot:m.241281 g.241281  ORF g.241281 m.241281 type:complete len:83 (-) comp33771_c3_seq11:476-724(-)